MIFRLELYNKKVKLKFAIINGIFLEKIKLRNNTRIFYNFDVFSWS